MPNDGTKLENLVCSIEKLFLDNGFQVEQRRRVFNEAGVQIAEFDIEVRGRVGSGKIAWLIECRDRPSEGAADGGWILELAGKRDVHRFTKVTAVSTTGFAPGAVANAAAKCVELREVKSLDISEFSEWIEIKTSKLRTQRHQIHHANFAPQEGQDKTLLETSQVFVRVQTADSPMLRNSQGQVGTLNGLVTNVLRTRDKIWADVPANGTPLRKQVSLKIDDSAGPLELVTPSGPVVIGKIDLDVELWVVEEDVPVATCQSYVDPETGEALANVVEYAPFKISGYELALGFQRNLSTGETHVVMRKHNPAKTPAAGAGPKRRGGKKTAKSKKAPSPNAKRKPRKRTPKKA